jgi:deoxyribose-phosphate aldolase
MSAGPVQAQAGPKRYTVDSAMLNKAVNALCNEAKRDVVHKVCTDVSFVVNACGNARKEMLVCGWHTV